LTDYDRDEVEARLKQRAEEIARRRQRLRASDAGLREGGDLADYDQHPADTGTETFEEELDETTDMLLAEEARQVDLALQRLADGSYGTCADCGREIPPERLAAIPESIRCIDDQRRYEGQLRESGPPPQDV
jgi:DnaK suppressor protein